MRAAGTAWRVRRTPYSLESGGDGSALWKSTDGGDTWKDISRNEGLPKKTLGIIYPGSYYFKTAAPERMEIVAGDCLVTLDDNPETAEYVARQSFDVPGNSGFTIEVKKGICEYICSFL